MIENNRTGRIKVMQAMESFFNCMEFVRPIAMTYSDSDVIRVYDKQSMELLSEFSVAVDSNSACLRDIAKHSYLWS